MDGDVCPLEELIEVAKETFVQRNAQFLVDEAHSTGVIGQMGAGLVCELGLEKDVAIRLHTFGKALASSGSRIVNPGFFYLHDADADFASAIVLGNSTIKNALTNFARSVIYTTAPTFPVVCAVRSAFNLMRAAQTKAVI